jgi:hypothetical protein
LSIEDGHSLTFDQYERLGRMMNNKVNITSDQLADDIFDSNGFKVGWLNKTNEEFKIELISSLNGSPILKNIIKDIYYDVAGTKVTKQREYDAIKVIMDKYEIDDKNRNSIINLHEMKRQSYPLGIMMKVINRMVPSGPMRRKPSIRDTHPYPYSRRLSRDIPSALSKQFEYKDPQLVRPVSRYAPWE